jgi:O-methyltransferase domain
MTANGDRLQLRQLIAGFQVSRAIHAAASIGLADHIGDSVMAVPDLALATGCEAVALERLLVALTAVGVLRRDPGGRYGLSGVGHFLRRDVPGTQVHRARLTGSPSFWRTWGEFDRSVRTGKMAFELVHGMDGWAYRNEHPEEGAIFDATMAADADWMAAAIIDVGDLGRFQHFVDVGGGDGTLLAKLLDRYPRAQGTLFDHPRVVMRSAETFAMRGLADRCASVGGDFFRTVPSGGDAYLLKWILHDWTDADCLRILRQCRHAMVDKARLIIVEYVLDPEHPDQAAALMDLTMLVMNGGRERSTREFSELLAAAGFHLVSVTPTPAGLSIIEALPA